jgi:hypothetical protein
MAIGVAQLIEKLTTDPKFEGSNPTAARTMIKQQKKFLMKKKKILCSKLFFAILSYCKLDLVLNLKT